MYSYINWISLPVVLQTKLYHILVFLVVHYKTYNFTLCRYKSCIRYGAKSEPTSNFSNTTESSSRKLRNEQNYLISSLFLQNDISGRSAGTGNVHFSLSRSANSIHTSRYLKILKLGRIGTILKTLSKVLVMLVKLITEINICYLVYYVFKQLIVISLHYIRKCS